MRAQAEWRSQRPWLGDTVVCDGLMPWTRVFLPPGARLVEQLRRFHDNGVDHVSLSVAAGQDGPVEAMACLGRLRRELGEGANRIAIAHEAQEIAAAKVERRMSVSFHFQTATPFEADLDLVEAFHAAGVRRAILAYNNANVFADGCHEPRNGGLTAAGRRLVDRMDAAGMAVDLSHCGERTALDALEADLGRPPVFSHSNARALHDHERNLSDAVIAAAAARGSYIGVNGVGMFLGAGAREIPAAMARHAAYLAERIGAERIGLGLDFMYLEGSDYGFYHAARDRWPRGYPPPPWDFLQPEQLGDLVAALEAAGFGRDELPGLLGANYLRLAA